MALSSYVMKEFSEQRQNLCVYTTRASILVACLPPREVCVCWLQAYQKAIDKAVKRVKEEDGEVHALDLGCGAGLFSVMAAKSGANSVVACDMHEPLCVATRKVRSPLSCSYGESLHYTRQKQHQSQGRPF